MGSVYFKVKDDRREFMPPRYIYHKKGLFLRSSLFWDVTPLRLIFGYRSFQNDVSVQSPIPEVRSPQGGSGLQPQISQ